MAQANNANIPVLTNAQIPTVQAFERISTAKPSTGIVDEMWAPAGFGGIRIWSGLSLDDAQRSSVGVEWLNDINAGTISTQTAIKGLQLAMSLKSMNPGRANPLLTAQVRPAAAANGLLAIEQMPLMNLFSSTPYTLRAQQIVQGEQQNPPPVQEQVPVGGGNNAPAAGAAPANEQDSQKRFAYCFLAMYMMKLVTKAPENLVQGVENMKKRFESFYGPSQTVLEFSLTMEKSAAYKEALQSQAKIAISYTHAVANTQQFHLADLDPKEVGVLSYNCFLPLSYTGMHAYTLILEIMLTSKCAINRLLNMFYVDVTAPALLKISDIIHTLERTEAVVDRDITFRYCTHWGPQYFAAIRSRNCTHLLYTAACAWKELSASDTVADPEKIAATSRLSEQMKRTLKFAGQVIGKTLKSQMLGGNQASAAFSLALNQGEPVVPEDRDEEEEEEDDDDGYEDDEARYLEN